MRNGAVVPPFVSGSLLLHKLFTKKSSPCWWDCFHVANVDELLWSNCLLELFYHQCCEYRSDDESDCVDYFDE